MLMPKRLAITALVVASFAVVGAQDSPDRPLLDAFTWRAVGPVNMGGRVDDVEAVESDPSVIYVGAATSGVWKTVNNGTTWAPVFDTQPNLSIGDIAVAPSNPDIVWVGTGEANQRQSTSYGGGVFKSIDAGKTWSFMGLGESGTIGRIVIDPRNPDVVWIAAGGDLFKANHERGVYKTSDGGRSWTNTRFVDDDTGFIDVAMDPSNSQTLIAASYQRRRTAWGFNGGGPGSALWKTADGGRTWKRLEGGGLPPYGNWGRVGLAFARSNPAVVYAMIEPGPQAFGGGGGGGGGGGAARAAAPLDPGRAGIWRSDDKGATWRLVSNENGRAMYFSQIRVDPKNPNTVFALERSLYKSTDGAKTFVSLAEGVLGRLPDPAQTPSSLVAPFERDAATSDLPPSHPDHHAMWIDPANPKHVILGHDGGVDFSYDGGRTWQLQNAMPMGQFYHVAADMRQPYWIYGGAQDNGVWGGPSRVRNNGGITRDHWFELAAGDGFHVGADPTDPDIVYMSVSGNGGQFLWRQNFRTGEQRFIRPTPPRRAEDRRNQTALPASGNIVTPLPPGETARFNWNPGFAISPHDPRTIYFGAQRLYTSHDRGDSWSASKDLTKAIDRDTLSIMNVAGTQPMTAKNDGVAAYGTIVAVQESPVAPGVLWVGTDDGNLQVSRDAGDTWTNVADNTPRFPANYYAESVEPSHFAAGTAYAAFDGHHSGDYAPHVVKTADYGQTWTDISAGLPSRGHVNVVREDRFNPNLLFVGTEFGFYVSLSGGKSWSRFMSGLPATKMDDVIVHPRDQDLVLATHGRSFYVLDDISPLQQLTDSVVAKSEHLFRPRPAIAWDEDKRTWHGGDDALFRAKNPPDAIVAYYLKAQASGSVRVAIVDADGKAVKEIDGPRGPGIHRVTWDLRGGDRQRVAPGSYTVRLSANGRTSAAPLTVLADPNR
jgi:photosystem II stability/assembly factor-like uncharacterized protein